MTQVDLYAEAWLRKGEAEAVHYQWLVYQEGDLARVDMFQHGHNGWIRYRGLEERLHGGTARTLLDETVSRWLVTSQENGYAVHRSQ